MEPRLEAWAAQYLGDPADIVVAAGARRITLAEAGFAALDLVYATDLAALERTLRDAIPDLGDTPLASTRGRGRAGTLRALGQVVGLASTLRSLIAGAQPLLPADLARPGDPPERDLVATLPELTGRVTALAGSLAAAVAALESTVAGIPASGVVDDPGVATTLGHAAYALQPFGIPLEPTPALPLDLSWVRSAWHAAEARAIAAQAAAAGLAALPADTPVRLAVEAAQDATGTVFGDGFRGAARSPPPSAATLFIAAVDNPAFPAPAASDLRRLVRDFGTVRTQVGRLSEALLVAGALGHRRSLAVVQLAERKANGDPAPGTTRWLAGPLPAEGPWPGSPVAHVIIDRVGPVDAGAQRSRGSCSTPGGGSPHPGHPRPSSTIPAPARVRTGPRLGQFGSAPRAAGRAAAVSPTANGGRRRDTDGRRADARPGPRPHGHAAASRRRSSRAARPLVRQRLAAGGAVSRCSKSCRHFHASCRRPP